MSLMDKLQQDDEEQGQGIDMSPLLDVVFILLIFFIVSTVFVRETGVEVDKPEAVTAQNLEQEAILIALTSQGEVVYDGANIGVAGVRHVVEPLQRGQPRAVVLQTDKQVAAELLVAVIDQAKLAGAGSISIATVAP